MRFRKKYLVIAILLLVIEVCIAFLTFHPIIRGFLGDVLIIPFLYTLLKTFFSFSSKKTMNGILLLAFIIEIFQYLNIITHLDIQSKVIRLLIGNTFDHWDFIAYLTGYLLIFISKKSQ